MDERERIEQAKRGDSTALATLLQAHYPFILKYMTKVTFDPHVAEDLTQEAMLRAIRKISSYNGQTKFSTWLMTISTRLYIDEWRKRKRERTLFDEESVMRKLKWQSAVAGDEWPEILELLGTLSVEMRTAIILKHYYGYSLEEIAEMADVPIGTVKSRIHSGLRIMRKELTAT